MLFGLKLFFLSNTFIVFILNQKITVVLLEILFVQNTSKVADNPFHIKHHEMIFD